MRSGDCEKEVGWAERPLSYCCFYCWEIRGPPPAPTSLFNTKRVAAEEQNREQGKTSAPSKHSRFTWFGLRAYVHGGKGGVYSLPVERDYMLQRYRHSFIAEESLIDSNSQT